MMNNVEGGGRIIIRKKGVCGCMSTFFAGRTSEVIDDAIVSLPARLQRSPLSGRRAE